MTIELAPCAKCGSIPAYDVQAQKYVCQTCPIREQIVAEEKAKDDAAIQWNSEQGGQ